MVPGNNDHGVFLGKIFFSRINDINYGDTIRINISQEAYHMYVSVHGGAGICL